MGLTEEQLRSNPIIQRMMQDFFKDQFKNLQMTQNNSGKDKTESMSQSNGPRETNTKAGNIKSPSDTTIYAPALQRKLTPGSRDAVALMPQNVQVFSQVMGGEEKCIGKNNEQERNEGRKKEFDSYLITNGLFNQQEAMNTYDGTNMNEVSHFVENIRLEQHPEDGSNDRARRKSDVAAANLEGAQEKADRTVLEAEKFRASIEIPGMLTNGGYVMDKLVPNQPDMQATPNNNEKMEGQQINMLNIGSGVSDDDFFHLTCHIEPNLIHKIEKGGICGVRKIVAKGQIRTQR